MTLVVCLDLRWYLSYGNLVMSTAKVEILNLSEKQMLHFQFLIPL